MWRGERGGRGNGGTGGREITREKKREEVSENESMRQYDSMREYDNVPRVAGERMTFSLIILLTSGSYKNSWPILSLRFLRFPFLVRKVKSKIR